MKEIELTQNKVALVDDADYDWLNQFKWFAYKAQTGGFYAMRHSSHKDGKRHTLYMAREILGLKRGDPRQADHINHNTLDNRRSELRICTRQENQGNRNLVSNTTSQFKGVHWHRRSKKWIARIGINRKRIHLGCFAGEEMAAMAYDLVARKVFGEFAYLNFGGNI